MKFDYEKFKTLVLYIIWKTSDFPNFGVTKLNKVLWFSDARAYEAFGEAITGETYIRRKYGPVPKHVEEVLEELSNEGGVQFWLEPFYDYEVKRYKAHEPVDTGVFSADELGFVDWWIRHVVDDHTAESISEKSHDYGWKIVRDGGELPYKAFLAKRIRQPREGEELEWAKQAAMEIESN